MIHKKDRNILIFPLVKLDFYFNVRYNLFTDI